MSVGSFFDVLVVGAGPAGIAAAIRVRWLKRYLMVPCKVALIDPAPLGGLTQIGTTYMTGPGWAYSADTLKPLLLSDIERFKIPHIRERVIEIQKKDRYFSVQLSDETVITSMAVILCPGMRLISNEPKFWKRGVVATSMGVKAAIENIRDWVSAKNHRKIVFVGTGGLYKLVPIIDKYRHRNCEVKLIIESNRECGERRTLPSGISRIIGRIVSLEGDEVLRRVVIEKSTKDEVVIDDVDLLVIDFMSLENTPSFCFECEDLELDDSGFIKVDRTQRTSIEGILAAGDATGMPAAVVPALSEGVIAGFGAYKYVYGKKFNEEPPLFAYYGYDRELSEPFQELPSYDPRRFTLELLDIAPSLMGFLKGRLSESNLKVAAAIVGCTERSHSRCLTVEELVRETSYSLAEVQMVINELLAKKKATLIPVEVARQ